MGGATTPAAEATREQGGGAVIAVLAVAVAGIIAAALAVLMGVYRAMR